MLCPRTRIEPQNEVMALSIASALFSCDVGKGECAPVGDASHYTAGTEDDVACRTCDSGDVVRVTRGRLRCTMLRYRERRRTDSLISLTLLPGRTFPIISHTLRSRYPVHRLHTTPINSYNMALVVAPAQLSASMRSSRQRRHLGNLVVSYPRTSAG